MIIIRLPSLDCWLWYSWHGSCTRKKCYYRITCLRMSLASFPGSLLNKRGRREPGNIHENNDDFLVLLWWYQLACRMKPPSGQNVTFCTRNILSTQQKLLTWKWTYKHRLHLKSWGKKFLGVQKGRKSRCPRLKFTVVGLWDWLAHHTSLLRVCMY